MVRTGDAGAVRHLGAGNDRPEQPAAGRVVERFERAAERIDEAVARRLEGSARVDAVVEDVVGDVDQNAVGIGAAGGNSRAHRCLVGSGLHGLNNAGQGGRSPVPPARRSWPTAG